MNKLMRVLVAAGAAALLLAGCSSAHRSGSSGSGATNTGTSATADAGLQSAQQLVAKYAPNPTSIGVTTKLTKKPSSDVTIAVVYSGTPVSTVIYNSVVQAASLLGWTVKGFVGATTAEKHQQLFSSALDIKPTAIIDGTGEPSVVGSANVARSTAQKTFVVCSSCTEPAPAPNWSTSISGTSNAALLGQVLSAGVVTASKGNANIQIITIPLFVTTQLTTKAFIDATKASCKKCQITDNSFSPVDAGTKIPGAMVSAIQRTPEVNWIVGGGLFLTGIQPALTAAGYGSGKVQQASYTGSTPNYDALRAGTQAADASSPQPIIAYRAVDAVARWVDGQDQVTDPLPVQLLTSDNIKSAVFNPDGVYLGVQGALDQFKQLWLLS